MSEGSDERIAKEKLRKLLSDSLKFSMKNGSISAPYANRYLVISTPGEIEAINDMFSNRCDAVRTSKCEEQLEILNDPLMKALALLIRDGKFNDMHFITTAYFMQIGELCVSLNLWLLLVLFG